jgi:hypothetical protein
MKNLFQIIVVFLLIEFMSIYAQDSKNFYSTRDSISGKSIYQHLKVLADDSLQGRGTGAAGGEVAANYIANQFETYQLEKIKTDNSYFQNIPMHGSLPQSSSELTIISDKDTSGLKYGSDYFLYRSGQQTYIPTPLPLVFVGFGIIAPEYDYNDYQNVDVEDKIVVYIDDEPKSEDEDYFNGQSPTIYSYSESKRRIALSRGAAGTIQISLAQYDDWEAVKKDFDTEDVTLAYSVTANLSMILNPKIADKLFNNSGYSFNDIVNMNKANGIKSFYLNTKLKFNGIFKERDFIAKNIIGFVSGSDPALNNSYLIISAHYDHLGIGIKVNGDSIYNGALDNAIGISVMLELAKAFSELKVKPKRSILFIATTGEEKGLLGSSYYIGNPVVPLYKTIADVNIDGIAMFKDFNSLVPVGTQYSNLDVYLNQTAERYGLLIEDIPPQFKSFDAFNKSDQLAFAIAGIPSVLVLEGLTNKTKSKDEVLEAFIDYYLERYHSPSDDLKQKIDSEAASKHAKILFDFCFHIADQIETPEWKPGSPFINARLRSIAEEK